MINQIKKIMTNASEGTVWLKLYMLPGLLLFPHLSFGAGDITAHSPLKLAHANIFDISSNIRGGIRRDTAVLYNLDLTAELDTGYFGLDNGTLFVYGLVNNAQELNPLVGDFQVSSNIDNSEVFRLYEFWYEQSFSDERASIKVGLFDLNSEFDVVEPGGLFLNSSHGVGPELSQTGLNGPSIFPSTSLSVRLQYRLNDRLLFRTAILDAVPNDPERPGKHKISLNEGALLIGEAEITLSKNWRAIIGTWHYTSKFNHIDQTIVGKIGGNSGIYAFAEGALNDRTSLWVRVGKANEDINQLSHYIGGGIVYKGLLPSRFNDSLGFAIAAAGNGNTFKELSARNLSPVDDYEITYELTYQFSVTDWLILQPDIQYIYHPSMDPTLKDALVVGVRIEIGSSW